jgi:putative two-component system response regulator
VTVEHVVTDNLDSKPLLSGRRKTLTTVTTAEKPRSQPAHSLIRYRILLVDDDVLNGTLIESVLRSQSDYDVFVVSDAESATVFLKKSSVDALLIDTASPHVDGFALCHTVRSEFGRTNIPIVLFSTSSTGADRTRALEAGAADIIAKPFQRTELMHRLRNLLRLKATQDQLCEVEHAMLTVSSLIEARDNYTHGHAQRVADNIEMLGRAALLSEEDIQLLRRAAFLKDIGKSGVPDLYLNQQTSWSPEERETLTERMAFPWNDHRLGFLTPRLLPIVRHCRENFDGSGFPDQLAGEQIPLGARMLSIVDAYDALISNRPFRAAHTAASAQAILMEGSGSQWDTVFVHLFIKCLSGSKVAGLSSTQLSLLAA